ncbi:hypothetical protein [uncultured Methylobacterium sp.]|uniref:hypothetical protein n=1 Tax=uncultured Methylobacterium sp. TaxID=157278 RepID=UPI00258EABD1|nr:hypothetical protein [uncultured Methylobacterium sp.]
MSIAAPSKRSYVKLPENEWAEVEALWAAGSATLAELSQRYGVTERGLQAHFAKHGTVKGASAKALAVQVNARVQAAQEADVEDLAERAKIIRDTTYAAASKTEKMLAATLDAADADPSQIYAAAAKIKMLMNAAATLERLHALKRSALGINDDTLVSDEMPALQIVNLTAEAIAEMRREQRAESMGYGEVIDGDVTDISDDEADDDINVELDDE